MVSGASEAFDQGVRGDYGHGFAWGVSRTQMAALSDLGGRRYRWFGLEYVVSATSEASYQGVMGVYAWTPLFMAVSMTPSTRTQRSKTRAVTLIGILPCLGEGEGRGFMFCTLIVA